MTSVGHFPWLLVNMCAGLSCETHMGTRKHTHISKYFKKIYSRTYLDQDKVIIGISRAFIFSPVSPLNGACEHLSQISSGFSNSLCWSTDAATGCHVYEANTMVREASIRLLTESRMCFV